MMAAGGRLAPAHRPAAQPRSRRAAATGGIRYNESEFSGGARQKLHSMFRSGRTSLPYPHSGNKEWPAEEGEILIHEGWSPWYSVGGLASGGFSMRQLWLRAC
jgi:hypothetical protein